MYEPTVQLQEVHDPSDIYFTGAKLDLFEDDPPSLQTGSVKYNLYDKIPANSHEIIEMAAARAEPLPQIPPAITLSLRTRLSYRTTGIAHVWTATPVGAASIQLPEGTKEIVAKIYDPAYYGTPLLASPFNELANTLLAEVDVYDHLKDIQGDKIPHYYGHFKAAIPSQKSRIVHVLLFEYIEAVDIWTLNGSRRNGDLSLCDGHNDALLRSAIQLWLDLRELGVVQKDFQPRNVLVYESSKPEGDTFFCETEACPLRHKVDTKDVRSVMVDFGLAKCSKQNQSEGEDESIDGSVASEEDDSIDSPVTTEEEHSIDGSVTSEEDDSTNGSVTSDEDDSTDDSVTLDLEAMIASYKERRWLGNLMY